MPEMGDRFGLIVFDEAHHLPGRSYREAALLCAAPMRMGLTATPERSDGRHADLADLIGPTVYRQEIREARGRTLADYDVVRIPVALGDEEQYRYDRASATVRSFMLRRQEQLRAEAAPGDEAPGAPSVVYLARPLRRRPAATRRPQGAARLPPQEIDRGPRGRETAGARRPVPPPRRRAGDRFRGVQRDGDRRVAPVPRADAAEPFAQQERREVLEGFAAGRFPVLVANRVLDEGVDVPAAKVAVVIGGMASTRQAKQRLGRILRRTRRRAGDAVRDRLPGNERRGARGSRRRSDAYDRVKRRRL